MKIMNHAEYQERMTTLSIEALRFIMADAYNAAQAMPDSPNAGYYLDELNYASMELARRLKNS